MFFDLLTPNVSLPDATTQNPMVAVSAIWLNKQNTISQWILMSIGCHDMLPLCCLEKESASNKCRGRDSLDDTVVKTMALEEPRLAGMVCQEMILLTCVTQPDIMQSVRD